VSSVAEARERIELPGSGTRVLVAGVTGYTGALAAWLVWRHPDLELAAITARSQVGTRLDELYPKYRVPLTIEELDLDSFESVEAAIVAYPHGASAPVVAEMRGRGLTVVDLSADFRLEDLPTYERYYGDHGAPELLDGAVYGLPELFRDRIADAELISNPGCYPTASLIALAPLAREGMIEDLVIDAKSGVSGAGRSAGEAMAFVAMDENLRPYGVPGHRHQPEILEKLEALSPVEGAPHGLTFVPHLVPLDQGELVSCYVKTSRSLDPDDLTGLFEDAYGNEPFVEVLDRPPEIRDVAGTNYCQVYPVPVEDRVVVFAAIDNLWKGASGQAVQNLNLVLGLEEKAGLT
jgi:N-acetyl-gamma-glutamyl-phosphate reductase